MRDTTYTDLLIRIHGREGSAGYHVEAWLDEDSHFTGGEFHLDQEALRAAELDTETYGLELFYALVDGPIRRAYDQALGRATARTEGSLRLRLWIDQTAAPLHALAWERLHHVQEAAPGPLATAETLPFSRYVPLEQAPPKPLAERPVHLLVVLSNPHDLGDYDLPALDMPAEIAALRASLDALQETGRVDVTLFPGRTALPDDLRAGLEAGGYRLLSGPATLDALVHALNAEEPVDVLHVVSHGALASDQRSVLFLEDEDGGVALVSNADLRSRFEDLGALPRLVFLGACESAQRPKDHGNNPFVGLAPDLIRAGVPAAVAMQARIPVAAARSLTQAFYRHLFEHGCVDVALNQARLALYTRERQTWAVPVLFTRLAHGRLFTADPLRTALRAMKTSSVFTPLSEDQTYIPITVMRLSGDLRAVDLAALSEERTPGQDLDGAFLGALTGEAAEHPRVIGLVGDAGMGKSVQLRRLGNLTAADALTAETGPLVLPVYVDLRELRDAVPVTEQKIMTLLQEALAPFWPAENVPIGELLAAEDGPRLRVFLDGSDALPDHVRARIWAALDAFMCCHARHDYVVAFKRSSFGAQPLPFNELLVLQPLSSRGLARYLTEIVSTPAGEALWDAIQAAQLHDLAARPWLLIQMLQQTVAGAPPRSRIEVLRAVVDGEVNGIAGGEGLRTHAAATLDALAWRMQTTFRRRLPLDEAFRILADVRGPRGYSLETLFQEFVTRDLLELVGDTAVAFARDNVRAYCAACALRAHAAPADALDEITATLGRHSRYRWWAPVLELYAGLTAEPAVLLRALLRDVALSEGEQVFLAARCLSILGVAGDGHLRSYLISALLWRLDPQHEPQVLRRVRVVEALGRLRAVEAVPGLVQSAAAPVRGEGEKYEYSSVRLAAVQALRQIVPPPFEAVVERHPALAEVLRCWADEDVPALKSHLEASTPDHGVQGLAAFALGDLQTEDAVGVLVDVFLRPGGDPGRYRNVSTALTLVDPGVVTERVILPLLEHETAPEPRPQIAARRNRRHERRENLIYLIGRIRCSHPRARAYLETCLTDCPELGVKGLAIQSLGWLHDRQYKSLLEDVALGTFEALELSRAPSLEECHYLQRKALEALYYVGDAETLERLRKRPFAWDPALERAYYWTTEELLGNAK